MGDVQTHCLDRRCHSEVGIFFVVIRGEEDALVICLQDLGIAGTDLFRVIETGKLCHDLFRTFRCKRRCDIVQHIIGQLVHHMNAAAVYVQYHIIVAQFILMNHNSVSSFQLHGEKQHNSYKCEKRDIELSLFSIGCRLALSGSKTT